MRERCGVFPLFFLFNLLEFVDGGREREEKKWCVNGILKDDLCCAKSCGLCGGAKCGSFPGGPRKCCRKMIEKKEPCKNPAEEACILPPKIAASLSFQSPSLHPHVSTKVQEPLTVWNVTKNGQCKVQELGAVLRDIHSEFAHSPLLLNRIRAALGHVPDAFELAVARGSDRIWGERSLWAPEDCGSHEERQKPSGCSRICNYKYARGHFPEEASGVVNYGVSGPVTVGKASTCDKFSDLPIAAKLAAEVPGYECVVNFPMAAFTGAGCNDDFTGVHASPTLAKNRPLVDDFKGLHHESGVVMPFKYKHHFWLPKKFMWSIRDKYTKKSMEATWEEKKPTLVWRGSLTAGPPPGVAAVQRCASPAGDAMSKSFRGEKGSIFVPGLPWRCRDGRYRVTGKKKKNADKIATRDGDQDGCAKAALVLRKQASRLELVQRWGDSKTSRSGIDVKFKFGAPHTQMKAVSVFKNCGMPNAMKSEMVTNESMGILEQLEHKYLLAVEGVDKASSTQWIMMSGSVLVMPPPSQESWLLEGRLAPWVHYVPCRPDFKDLPDIVDWLRSHDDEAKKIANASAQYMTREFGEAADEHRLSAAVLRLYVAYMHAAATLTRSKAGKDKGNSALARSSIGSVSTNSAGLCWRNAVFHDNAFRPPSEHTAFLHQNWRFKARLEEVGGSAMVLSVPLGLSPGDTFYVSVPLHEDDPEYDPNGVWGIPCDTRRMSSVSTLKNGEGCRAFKAPIRVTIPPKNEWTREGEFRASI